MLLQREYRTRCGVIHYWIRKEKGAKATLVFLPGLTADHHLFDKQIAYFEGKYSVFVWDAPGHAASWPFDFTFDLFDKAKWLDEMLSAEGLGHPLIIGQSMGGYVGQAYAQLFLIITRYLWFHNNPYVETQVKAQPEGEKRTLK